MCVKSTESFILNLSFGPNKHVLASVPRLCCIHVSEFSRRCSLPVCAFSSSSECLCYKMLAGRYQSDIFSMFGSLMIWAYYPSYNSFYAPSNAQQACVSYSMYECLDLLYTTAQTYVNVCNDAKLPSACLLVCLAYCSNVRTYSQQKKTSKS